MKKLSFLLSIVAMCLAFVTTGINGKVTTTSAQQVQTADSFKFNTLDTVTNTATKTHTKVVKGLKSVVVLSVDVNAISSTSGTIKYYRSIGGGWALIETDNIGSTSATYDCVIAPGSGLAYKIEITGGSSQSFSYTARGMYK